MKRHLVTCEAQVGGGGQYTHECGVEATVYVRHRSGLVSAVCLKCAHECEDVRYYESIWPEVST